jgi:DNA-binding CsgD family transcriptional regulator
VIITPDVEARFWAKVDRSDKDGCWPWKAYVDLSGYGRFSVAGKPKKATHVALVLDGKPRPGALHTLHSCDNPCCVNPAHLRWGTNAENMADMKAKGRGVVASRQGEGHPNVKINEHAVLAIRADSRSYARISADHGINSSTVWRIKTRVLWRHL